MSDKPRKKREAYCADPVTIIENAEDCAKGDKVRAKAIATFALTLNKELNSREIDQEKMAEKIGISSGTISNYRNGKNDPSLSRIRAIADYLKVDCHYLMTGISAKNCTVNSEIGLSDRAIELLKYLHTHGNDEEQRTISFINRVLSDPDNAPGKLVNTTLFSWLEQYVTFATVKAYDLYEHRAVIAPGIQLTSGLVEGFGQDQLCGLYKEHLLHRIRDLLEKYSKEEAE